MSSCNATVCSESGLICDEQHLLCVCPQGFTQSSDLFGITECSVHTVTSMGLYGSVTMLWFLGFVASMGALCVLSRKEMVSYRNQQYTLGLSIVISVLYVVVGVLILTAQPYGSRSLGVDIVTTALYSTANLLTWTFVIFRAIYAGSGISLMAISYNHNAKSVYSTLAPILITCSTAASILPFVIYFDLDNGSILVQSIYVGDFYNCI
jgi:hypothetical protein